MHNKKQEMEGRHRDEGKHSKHMRADGGVPITGQRAASIHGKHTGEMQESMTGSLDKGTYSKHTGRPGDHEEEK